MTTTALLGSIALLAFSLTAMQVRSAKSRQLLLLGLSYAFYSMWFGWSIIVLVLSSLINFGLGIYLRRRPHRGRLWLGILINTLLLSVFKYHPATLWAHIWVPIGISFWTFQALSYLFDVYGEDETSPSLLEFCLYMAFWPTVISGPICRLSRLLPQFRKSSRFSQEDLAIGFRRIAIGVFMKLFLSQLLVSEWSGIQTVQGALDNRLSGWSGLDVWFLAIGFGFQLFFDFAGYSHIVIGAARIFGFEIDENFDSPYLALRPSHFWARWHMSLSSWIRDYVFLPMAMSLRRTWWPYFSLVFAMILFGIWHGARLTFVIWGAYHGTLLVLERIWEQLNRSRKVEMTWPLSLISWSFTFLSISLGWILFRASSTGQALRMIQAVLSIGTYNHVTLPHSYCLVVIILVTGYFICEIGARQFCAKANLLLHRGEPFTISDRFFWFFWENRWPFLTPMILILFLMGAIMLSSQGGISPFIYTSF